MYDGTMLMNDPELVLIFLLMSLFIGCASADQVTVLQDALVSGDQTTVDVFTDALLNDRLEVTPAALHDDRDVSRSIILRVDEESRRSQYGIDRVSEFFICLLQVKYKVSSRDTLPEELAASECAGADECEACNSLTFPLSNDVRYELKAYWSKRLRAAER